jgi:CheY-like chemotaxis protein
VIDRKKILVAEDDAALIEVMQTILEGQGYEVLVSLTGSNIEKLLTHMPHIILLDIGMSGVSGLDICKRIKADTATQNIPVVLFSSNMYGKAMAKEAGADGFLSKPFSLDHLFATINRHIK